MPSSSKSRLRVLLADDHVLVREGLKAILEQEGFEVRTASDGRAAIALCDTLRPDVAVLDIAMPLLNGIDAARNILKLHPDTKIVLLTMYAEESYVLAGLRAGITGYVLKSSAASSLVQAIHAASKGDIYLSPGVSRTVVQAYLSNATVPADPLSNRERQVLQLIAEGKTMKEIGDVLGISPRTAETHRTRIMNRLDIHDVAGLVRYAIEHRLTHTGQGAGDTDRPRGAGSSDRPLPRTRPAGDER
jgi:DNA-binding NarL/FixJ family response regulator